MTAPAILLWALAPRGPAEPALTRVRRVKPVGLMPAWAHHCGDMWRAHVLEATGRDVCDIVGPSPRRPRDWAALMRRLGVRSIAGVISAVHGEPIPYRLAARGDIVLRGWAIGICRGDRAEFYGGEMVEMCGVDAAWRVSGAPEKAPTSPPSA